LKSAAYVELRVEQQGPNDMTFDDDMMKALEADGEKLRQMTGEDHGPFGTVNAVEREMHRLCDEGKMTTSHADEVARRLFGAAHGI
jgi:hypothetical protein